MGKHSQGYDLAGLPEVFVDTMYRSLGHLFGDYPEIFDELVAAVRDGEHTMSGDAALMLGMFGLLDPEGRVRSSVRPVVLAAAQGEGPELVSYSGIAEYRVWERPGPAPVPMTDQEKRDLIVQCLKIADIFDAAFCGRCESRRAEGLNAFYDRTTSGLYLESRYGCPSTLWTPWGSWQFARSVGGRTAMEESRMVSAFMAHLDAELLIPLQQNRFGAFGPVYKLSGIDGEKLPVPGEIRPPATTEEYEAANAEWATLGGPHRAPQSA
ncbi:hypothetical protein [Mycolicibacterium fortuitum]|uniref:Uncharacterized protein n=2 Tax=Mycolicibacterium fortuitum TaxID=1766 RepID=A0AAE4VGM5_MYCFO|nr:hypothetical protein [Mycolicibacterium fortuitum]MCV7137937.1 hypothetical protein [Mycolicibacterium fortuitum]MDV7194504.1 hypothetical protein [Mycolicibacterium fortuitum]MDV7207867.1 hypothetical protein [Mycolicibacterium fortuitum]MDV7229164.1 hypothetical protein [Mycolicibacterium fortuitum]MDV7260864.1 hypothetical protein [Mycolicibacterium fortuitum]